MAKDIKGEVQRGARVRKAIRERAYGRPRLSVFRSSEQIYAQIIDDGKGATLVSASSLEKPNRAAMKTGATVAAAKEIGKQIAAKAAAAGIKQVVFEIGRAHV